MGAVSPGHCCFSKLLSIPAWWSLAEREQSYLWVVREREEAGAVTPVQLPLGSLAFQQLHWVPLALVSSAFPWLSSCLPFPKFCWLLLADCAELPRYSLVFAPWIHCSCFLRQWGSARGRKRKRECSWICQSVLGQTYQELWLWTGFFF